MTSFGKASFASAGPLFPLLRLLVAVTFCCPGGVGAAAVATEAEVKFCARAYTGDRDEFRNDDGRNDKDPIDDPLYCRSEPEPFETKYGRPYGACTLLTLRDVPSGFSDEDAASCLVGSFDDTLLCYYNLLTREFCAKFEGSGLGRFDCSSVEDSGGFQVYYGSDCCYTCSHTCRFWLLLKRGTCDTPAEDPALPEPPVTDEFVNAQNERINGQGCPLSDLAPASASDVTRTLVKYERCYLNDSAGTETCYDQEPVVLEGRRLQYVYPRDDGLYIKGQRRDGGVVCCAWWKKSVGDSVIVNDSTTKECQEICSPLGEEVTLVTHVIAKQSAGYYHTTEFRVTAYDGGSNGVPSEGVGGKGTGLDPDMGASSSGTLCSFRAIVLPIIANVLSLVVYTVL